MPKIDRLAAPIRQYRLQLQRDDLIVFALGRPSDADTFRSVDGERAQVFVKFQSHKRLGERRKSLVEGLKLVPLSVARFANCVHHALNELQCASGRRSEGALCSQVGTWRLRNLERIIRVQRDLELQTSREQVTNTSDSEDLIRQANKTRKPIMVAAPRFQANRIVIRTVGRLTNIQPVAKRDRKRLLVQPATGAPILESTLVSFRGEPLCEWNSD